MQILPRDEDVLHTIIFIYSDELLNNTADFWASHNPTLQHLRVLCQTNYAPPTPLSLLLACSCAWSIGMDEERRLLWVFVQCPSLNSVWIVYGGPSMSLIKTGIHLASFWWSKTKNRGPSFCRVMAMSSNFLSRCARLNRKLSVGICVQAPKTWMLGSTMHYLSLSTLDPKKKGFTDHRLDSFATLCRNGLIHSGPVS